MTCQSDAETGNGQDGLGPWRGRAPSHVDVRRTIGASPGGNEIRSPLDGRRWRGPGPPLFVAQAPEPGTGAREYHEFRRLRPDLFGVSGELQDVQQGRGRG